MGGTVPPTPKSGGYAYRTYADTCCITENYWLLFSGHGGQGVVSRNITYMRVFALVPWCGGVKRQWDRLVEDGNSDRFNWPFVFKLQTGYTAYVGLFSFSVIPKCTTLNDHQYLFHVKCWLGFPRAARSAVTAIAELVAFSKGQQVPMTAVAHANGQRSQILHIFTVRCTIVQSAVLRLHVVRPSVCPYTCNVGGSGHQDHIGWKSWKLIARYPLLCQERVKLRT